MKLFSWGANSHGQLGQNIVCEACCVPTEINILCVESDAITSIVGGGGHTLMLDCSGRAYSCGWNNKGQLGIAEENASIFQPIESLHGHNTTQLACGWDSSAAVTSDGSLLVWGSNSHCQLGLAKQKFSVCKKPQIVPVARVKQVSLGLRHLSLVTEDGKVYTSGTGNKGQLGIGINNTAPKPELNTLTQVLGLENIISVSCGQHHNLALSDSGKIFGWGDNKFGQLGFDSSVQPVVYTPQEIPISEKLGIHGRPLSVYAGWTHSVLITDKEELVNWGRNTYGQLGSHRERATCWVPSILRVPDGIQQFVVGSEHNLVLAGTGEVRSWGWNEHGNCGTGIQENVLEPSLVVIDKTFRATAIGGGACHCFVILK